MDILFWFGFGIVAGAYLFHKPFRTSINGYVKRFFNKKRS
jgi:hypothetical protein